MGSSRATSPSLSPWGPSGTDARQGSRTSEIHYGVPSVNEDGTVSLHPIRGYNFELTEEKLEEYIVRFASFVEKSIQRGATRIYWA